MRALICEKLGGPEQLRIVELPIPQPKMGEILVRVRFAALNFFDSLIIQGRYQQKPEMPFSPSAEFAGEVVAGEGWEAGTRVAGFIGWGAAREYILVRAEQLVIIPDGVEDEAAAGLAVTYGTAIHGLQSRAQLKPGESLAILGAAGGAGQAAIEIGKILGAKIVACASSEEKLADAQRLGADVLIDYSQVDLKEALKAHTQGAGVDVVYDPVGGDLAEPALRATAWGGRYLVVGFASGDIPQIPANLLLVKGSSLVGVHWSAHAKRDAAGFQAEFRQLLGLVQAKKIAPQIHASFALEDWQGAYDVIVQRQARGKILLKL